MRKTRAIRERKQESQIRINKARNIKGKTEMTIQQKEL